MNEKQHHKKEKVGIGRRGGNKQEGGSWKDRKRRKQSRNTRQKKWGVSAKTKKKKKRKYKERKKETRREKGKRKKKAKWKQESWHLLSCLQINIYITGMDLKNKNWLIFESYHMKDIFDVGNFVNIHRRFKFIEWKTVF